MPLRSHPIFAIDVWSPRQYLIKCTEVVSRLNAPSSSDDGLISDIHSVLNKDKTKSETVARFNTTTSMWEASSLSWEIEGEHHGRISLLPINVQRVVDEIEERPNGCNLGSTAPVLGALTVIAPIPAVLPPLSSESSCTYNDFQV
jgi:hypothetical protein